MIIGDFRCICNPAHKGFSDMKFDDDNYYEKGKYQSTMAAVIVFSIIAVVIIVLIANADKIKRNANKTVASTSVDTSDTVVSASFDDYVTPSSLHPSDLDFYDLYPVDDVSSGEETEDDSDKEKEKETDPATDGKHTLVTYYDGTQEWVSISKYITTNVYDYTNLYDQDGIMEYTRNGRVISSFGVDISKEQEYVDFNKLKNAGCDFVMIRVGQRGYTSGLITEDEYFADNIRRAKSAGLDLGVYFWSQAVTEEEAEEEAQFVLDKIKGYNLIYPVAFVMEYSEDGTSRVESLTRNEKTMVARAFLKKIDEAGYKTVIYGDKAWLIKYLELNKVVSDFDVWLSEQEDMPTYPYEFTMWQYNRRGRIDGIKGDVNFNISMVDYSLR